MSRLLGRQTTGTGGVMPIAATAAELMTTAVPARRPDESVVDALEALRGRRAEEASHVYLVDDGFHLVGQVRIESLLASAAETRLFEIRGEPPLEVRPEDRAEAVALLAVERSESDVAVVDANRRFLGAIPIARLLALLHDEHVADFLRLGGVGASHPHPREVDGPWRIVRARLPWLALGLAGSTLMAAVVSLFRSSFDREIALAFFLPSVVYMADAIGTQTETVLVRSLAYGPVSFAGQLAREGKVGLVLGLCLGAVATVGLTLFAFPAKLAIAVGLSLFATAVEATLIASILPICLGRMNADPALASGPLATVAQDVLSVAIYLAIGTAIP